MVMMLMATWALSAQPVLPTGRRSETPLRSASESPEMIQDFGRLCLSGLCDDVVENVCDIFAIVSGFLQLLIDLLQLQYLDWVSRLEKFSNSRVHHVIGHVLQAVDFDSLSFNHINLHRVTDQLKG